MTRPPLSSSSALILANLSRIRSIDASASFRDSAILETDGIFSPQIPFRFLYLSLLASTIFLLSRSLLRRSQGSTTSLLTAKKTMTGVTVP